MLPARRPRALGLIVLAACGPQGAVASTDRVTAVRIELYPMIPGYRRWRWSSNLERDDTFHGSRTARPLSQRGATDLAASNRLSMSDVFRRRRGVPRGMADDGRFDDFYDRALPVVYGYFFRRCGGRKDVAEDLTQDTFLSAVRSLDRGVNVEADLPWVVAIARRRLIDYYRREAHRREGQRTVPLEVISSPARSASFTTLAEARLLAALDLVPTDQRLALLLRYVDDLPVREVAGLMGRSEQATESLIRRGRSSLHQAYEEVDVD